MATVDGHSIWSTARQHGAEGMFMGEHPDDGDDSDRKEFDGKWPAWMVTLGVLIFCTAFWAGAYFVFSLLN